MNKIERIYLISIDRSASFRTENINNLKRYIRENLNLDIHTRGIDCIDVMHNPDRINEYKQNGIFIKKDRWNYCGNGNYRQFYPGEIGCYLSHLEVWQDIVKNKIKHALIFEDDSLIKPEHFFNRLHLIMSNLPENGYYISLYHSPQTGHIRSSGKFNEYLYNVRFDLWGTVSYILDLQKATEFVENLTPLLYPLDQAITHYASTKNRHMYLSTVPLVGLCDKRSIIRHSKHNS